ncbi:Uncharacterized protein PHSC3_000524 [Chlamydiales bacterium STE3]|nr:Uncharacterized protein PHSC3_000524 [Chlamydiales bacterium STE3]
MGSSFGVYQQRLNLQNATFSRVEHEEAMVAVVYKITAANGTEQILKISSRESDYFREVFFLKHFAGKLPVPEIVELVPPETGVDGAILMECLPGTLLKKADLNSKLSFEIGSHLACIHLNRLNGYGDIIGNLNTDPRLYFSLKFEEGLEECSPHFTKSYIEQCRHFFTAHLDILTSVDGPCVVHRDFRPGNLMVHHGQLQGIIDWAGARASFAEEDFCSWECEEWINLQNRAAFLAGYATIRPIPDYKCIMPFLRFNKAVAIVGFTVKCGTWNNRHSKIYQLNRNYLDVFCKRFR